MLDATRIRCPDRVIDRREGRVTVGQTTLSLSPTELRLLNYLADRPGRVVERDELWRAVWHQAPLMQSRAIDKTVRRLRTKIERDPASPFMVESVYGVGYRLNVDAPQDDEALAHTPPVPPDARLLDAGSTDATPIIGRDAELAALGALIAASGRPVVLVGPAGVGKSRLARALVRALSIGRGLRCAGVCELESGLTRTELVERISAGLGLGPCTDLLALCARIERLGSVSMVLDDVEGLASEVCGIVRAITASAPDARIILTSRLVLGEACARVFAVEPLGAAHAVEMFQACVRHVSPSRAAAWMEPKVHELLGELVERLDRLPLAIELAASRTSIMSPRELGDHLAERFSLLRDPLGRRTGRHASLRAALDASWALLSSAEREVLMGCSSLPGGFSLTVVRAAAAASGDVIDTLHRLVAHSLVTHVNDDAERPMALLACVRDYAAERMLEAGLAGGSSGESNLRV